MAANRTRSIAIITGRLRRNSTHGPSGNAISAPTAGPTAASADTWAGLGVQHQHGDERERAEAEPGTIGADGVRRPQPAELPPQGSSSHPVLHNLSLIESNRIRAVGGNKQLIGPRATTIRCATKVPWRGYRVRAHLRRRRRRRPVPGGRRGADDHPAGGVQADRRAGARAGRAAVHPHGPRGPAHRRRPGVPAPRPRAAARGGAGRRVRAARPAGAAGRRRQPADRARGAAAGLPPSVSRGSSWMS